jgi:glycerol-3-phosphate O-acyltransferase
LKKKKTDTPHKPFCRSAAERDILSLPEYQWFRDEFKSAADIARFKRVLRRMGAEDFPRVYHFWNWVFQKTFGRCYQTPRIHFANESEFLKAKEEGTIIVCPNHESLYDPVYVRQFAQANGLLPFASLARRIMIPFFLTTEVFRWSGTYFLPGKFRKPIGRFELRSLKVYVEWLWNQRFHQQIYLEGELNRKGSLATPRLGYLRWLGEHLGREKKFRPIWLLPIRIQYDQIADAETIAMIEAYGSTRRRLAWIVLRAFRHIFASYGEIDIWIGRPIRATANQTPKELAAQVMGQISNLGEIKEMEVVARYLLNRSNPGGPPTEEEMYSFVSQLPGTNHLKANKLLKCFYYLNRRAPELAPIIWKYYTNRYERRAVFS